MRHEFAAEYFRLAIDHFDEDFAGCNVKSETTKNLVFQLKLRGMIETRRAKFSKAPP